MAAGEVRDPPLGCGVERVGKREKLALTNCPKCSRELSDASVSCPHCGYPLTEQPDISAPAASPIVVPDERFRALSFGFSGTVAGLWWAIAALFASAAVSFVSAYLAWNSGATLDEITNARMVALGTFGFGSLVLPIVGVLFFTWVFKAYKSGESLGAVGRRWGAGWTIGAWFIPLANVVLPKLVVNEIDRMSNPQAGPPPIGERWKGAGRLLTSDLWWAALIGGWLMLIWGSYVYVETATNFETGTSTGYLLLGIGNAGLAAAAALAGTVVFTIGMRLRDRQPLMDEKSAREGLFESLLRPSRPIELRAYVILTSGFYACAAILAILLAAAEADQILYLLVLIPLMLAWITIARRFTSVGWNPIWMLVAWPFSSVIWLILMFLPADIDKPHYWARRFDAGPKTQRMLGRLTPGKIILGLIAFAFIYLAVLLMVGLAVS